MEPTHGILENRKAATAISVFWVFESVKSWRSAVKYPHISHRVFSLFGHQFQHDPVLIFGLAFAILVAASVACNSPFRPDRFLFGSTVVALVTALIRQFASLTPFS